MDNKCSRPALIHSFNPKPFKDIDTAIFALNKKDLATGEIAIAYYNDVNETRGIGAVIATGNILPGGNQIFKNTVYTDKLIKVVKESIESNSVDISVIEENVNNNIADIALIKEQLKSLSIDSSNNQSSVDNKMNEINEIISKMKEDMNNIIDNIHKVVADASQSLTDSTDTIYTDFKGADTSLKNYIDDENLKISQKIDDISLKNVENKQELLDKINSNTSTRNYNL